MAADELLIGVLSDTHGTLDPRAYGALADCGHIIHAGDICEPAVLRELETLAPVTAVLGNNDFPEYGSAVGRFARPVLGGVRFLVAHYPQDVELGRLSLGKSRAARRGLTPSGSEVPLGDGPLQPGDSIPAVCIHGHTHVPRLVFGTEARPAQYILNPGSVFRPRGGNPRSLAKIAVADGQVQGIRIESLDGDTLLAVGEMLPR